MIACDFNVTPYSPTVASSFEQPPFERAGGLTGTLPTALPAFMRIPIDHALSVGAVEMQSSVVRYSGWNHLPFTIELRPPI